MTRTLPPAHEQHCLAQNGRNTMTFRLVIDRDNHLIWLIHRIPRPSFSGDAANTDWCGVIVPQEQAIKLHERCCTGRGRDGPCGPPPAQIRTCGLRSIRLLAQVIASLVSAVGYSLSLHTVFRPCGEAYGRC